METPSSDPHPPPRSPRFGPVRLVALLAGLAAFVLSAFRGGPVPPHAWGLKCVNRSASLEIETVVVDGTPVDPAAYRNLVVTVWGRPDAVRLTGSTRGDEGTFEEIYHVGASRDR